MEPGPDKHPRLRRALVAPLLAALFLLASAASAEAATISVNTTSDVAPSAGECSGSPGDCSLRQAIDAAQPGDTVALGANTYSLTLGNDIEIAKSITLQGSGVSSTTIDGSQNSGDNQRTARILRTDWGATVTIEDLTLTGGDDESDEVDNCSPCDTASLNGGGALWNDGATVNVSDVAFANNPGGAVGGVLSTSGGTVNLTNVSFTNDQAAIGGALFTHDGTVTGNGVTFEDDATGCCGAGAVYLLRGTVTLTNSTVVGSGGASAIGGGIHNGAGTLTLTNDTLSGNVRGQLMTDTTAITSVENTIIGNGYSEGDGDCIAPGRPDDVTDASSGPAITNDLGHNIDQDGSCDLDATGDSSNVDPKLAPIADNGGPTRTKALLAGSPALGDPSPSDCPSEDQRGFPRPDGSCDIGAFEAVLNAAPTATTGGAQDITDSSADLSATINLQGEAGGFHFLYGTTDDPADFNPYSEVAAGAPDGDAAETQELTNLTPNTTYYYEAVADNATGSTAGTVEHFTTAAGPPVLSNVTVASVTDTTATITFTLDPEGADTYYIVAYCHDTTDCLFTNPTDIGSASGPQNLSVTLTDLTPGTAYNFGVIAGSSVESVAGSGNLTFTTDRQVMGIVGRQVTVSDSGTTDGSCPTPASVAVDWGDDSSDNGAQISCQPGDDDELDYTVTDTHTYSAPGDYLIQIDYGDLGSTTDVYADISPAPGGLQNTELPQINGTPQQGQTLTATDGKWDGNPTTFGYQWQDCDRSGQNCTDTGAGANTYTPGPTDVGQTIRVIVTATNDAGGSVPATSEPTAPVLPPAPFNTGPPQIDNTNPQQGQTLTVTNGTWDNNPLSYLYQWQDCDQDGQNCTDTGTDSNSYTVGQNDVGKTIEVTVIAVNTGGNAQATSTPTATVIPLAPSNTGLPQIDNTSPQQGQTLTATTGAWDNNPTAYHYQWQDCDQNGQNCTDTGTDSDTYQLTGNDVGSTIEVTVTAVNAGGSSPETVGPTATVIPLAPANAEPPQISNTTPEQGQTLTTTNGGWDNNPTAYHFQWQDCDQDGQNCSDTGTDSNTYQLTGNDVGSTIEVTVTALNAGGSAMETSAPTAAVIPLPPSNNGLPQINGLAQQGQTLTATPGTWDGNPTTFDYQWQDCDGQGCTDTGTDANTYTLGQNDVGHTVQVLVTATNTTGPSTPVASNQTAVVQPAPASPTPNTPPATPSSSPTVLTTAPTVTVTGAGFSGSVTPNGLSTQAYFQYALDPKYTGGGPLVYTESTSPQTVGSDFVNHDIGPVPVAGLLPNAVYHVRLVATNIDGTTYGPDVTFTTQAGPAPGLPALGKSENIAPVSGLVLIEVKGKFVPLTEISQIPTGSVIDATHGTFNLITATGRKGKTQHGEFGGAVIRLTQGRTGKNRGLATLTLLEGVFGHGPSYGVCRAHTAGDESATVASAKKTLQLLHASAHGKFTTKGHYGAATVLGTKWTIADRCDGTLIHDLTDSVVVTDFVHHKTVVLHAGQSYLVKAPGRHP